NQGKCSLNCYDRFYHMPEKAAPILLGVNLRSDLDGSIRVGVSSCQGVSEGQSSSARLLPERRSLRQFGEVLGLTLMLFFPLKWAAPPSSHPRFMQQLCSLICRQRE